MTSTVCLQFQRPGSPGFASACAGFDLSAIPTPDVAVSVTDEHDVRAAVRFAADHGMPVAVRSTGHGPVAGVDHGVLVDTRALSTVTVDPARRTATAGGGVRWAQVLTQTAPLRLIPLCGSSPDVGVAAYTLGGGLGPLGRLHGWAADRVRRIRLVTPDGELREVTAHTDPELFWALRGGAAASASSPRWSSTSFPATPSTAAGSTCRANPRPSCSPRSAGAPPPRPTS